MQQKRCGDIWLPSGVQYDDPRFEDSPGDKPPLVPSTVDDEFEDGSIGSQWSWVNQGTATIAEVLGYTTLTSPTQAATNYRSRVCTVSSAADITIAAKWGPSISYEVDFNEIGLILRNSSSSKSISFGYFYGTTNYPGQWLIRRNTNDTTISSTLTQNTTSHMRPMYTRFKLVGTTIAFWHSNDGVGWTRIATEALATFITSFDQAGFYVNTGNIGLSTGINVYWFRVTNP